MSHGGEPGTYVYSSRYRCYRTDKLTVGARRPTPDSRDPIVGTRLSRAYCPGSTVGGRTVGEDCWDMTQDMTIETYHRGNIIDREDSRWGRQSSGRQLSGKRVGARLLGKTVGIRHSEKRVGIQQLGKNVREVFLERQSGKTVE